MVLGRAWLHRDGLRGGNFYPGRAARGDLPCPTCLLRPSHWLEYSPDFPFTLPACSRYRNTNARRAASRSFFRFFRHTVAVRRWSWGAGKASQSPPRPFFFASHVTSKHAGAPYPRLLLNPNCPEANVVTAGRLRQRASLFCLLVKLNRCLITPRLAVGVFCLLLPAFWGKRGLF